jgi:AcrR family transcriptional regulator/DNA-binding MarR family transcriptional regulator
MPVEAGVRRDGPVTRGRNGGASPRGRIAELQRARLLAGAVLAAQELGWSATTVAHITARARVSRRTFYDLFEGREDCLLAVLGDIAERVEGEIATGEVAGLGWADRVRGGLLAILSFFDREPVLARVCVVQALQGGPRVLAWREEVLARLAAIVDEGRTQSTRSQECTDLTAEGLVGAACAIVYARLLADRRPEPLTGLLGELMGLIVLPYQGPGAARRERRRSLPALPQGDGGMSEHAQGVLAGSEVLREVPMRLTYRTARVLDGVATRPGASNRMIADHAGITDQGQVSKLLARLQRLGLLANTGAGQAKGEPNVWTLTPIGRQVADSIGGTYTTSASTNQKGPGIHA